MIAVLVARGWGLNGRGSSVAPTARGGEVVEAPLLDGAGVANFDGLTPWRVFRSCRAQTHYSGLYWSAVMRGHVGYESRLELAWLLLGDRDPRWRLIISQPFQLVATIGGRVRRHVPDFLAVRDDGLVTVVDVKPRHRLQDPTVAFTFAWTREFMEQRGWVWSGRPLCLWGSSCRSATALATGAGLPRPRAPAPGHRNAGPAHVEAASEP